MEQHLNFARMLARRLARRLPPRTNVEELESDAYFGLLKAAESFDDSRGVTFRTFSAARIKGAMLDGLRQRGGLRHKQRLIMRSLAEPIRGEDGQDTTLGDCIPSRETPVVVQVELRDEVQRVARVWDALYADIRIQGLTRQQIAVTLNVSPAAIAQRLRKVRKLLSSRR